MWLVTKKILTQLSGKQGGVALGWARTPVSAAN
jgi:hypothetical protein